MEPGLEDVYLILAHQADHAVLPGYSPGPDVGAHVLEWFGFADARKGVPQHRLHEVQDAQGGLTVCFYPVTKILEELLLKDRFTILHTPPPEPQAPSHAAIQPSNSVQPRLLTPG